MTTARGAGPPASGPGDGGASTPPATSVLRDRNFLLYFVGVVVSEVGIRGTFAINLYHVFLLTGSTASVGFVGLFQFIALVLLAPLGGALADRLDRRRVVQVTQAASMLVSAALAVATFADVITVWQIYFSVLLNTAALTFDSAARRALIPAVVARHHVVKAFALVNPGRELAYLTGPALGGLLVAVGGPGLMYAFDAVSYTVLIGMLSLLRLTPMEQPVHQVSIWRSMRDGIDYVRSRPIVWQLLALDFVTMLFGAWRVILPALAEDILMVGPTGYGLLNSAVPAGALVGSWIVYRAIDRLRGGRIILVATASFGFACIALAQSRGLAMALAAAWALGVSDAMWSTVQQAAIQVETPDAIRGRVSALSSMGAKGGPALGSMNIGLIAGAIGPVAALSVGALVPIGAAALVATVSPGVRDYRMPAVPT